ncbi:Alpha/Beta hydrolase protein [Podospora appendiculata]|uniref:Alpha/Beta hydrolase protein n=1 Tax=Podospora appendiculata TaxID=314037 RepID=A0AAE0X018_9PEZI|nr:Alpha/Beta hydrolase protein [Podospora appendiculata]
MALASFSTLPAGLTGVPVPYTFHVPNNDLRHLPNLARAANIGVPTWYNTHANAANGTFGVSRDWLLDAQETWVDRYDWRAHEAHYNRLPHYKINVTTPSDGQVFELHFAALFSKRRDAVPAVFMHGWPSAWLEFLPMLDLLAAKYTADTLPYHIIVPSIPDFGLSSRTKVDRELTLPVAAEAMNQLMRALGFKAYVAQGGDVGYALAQYMCGVFDECKAFHVNFFFMTTAQYAAVANVTVTPAEQAQLALSAAWASTGSSYSYQMGTRPATTALALESSPIAMLAWMGEKFIEWSDNRTPLPLDTILSFVSFYWHTKSFGRAMWSYRALTPTIGQGLPPIPLSLTKPFGFSSFRQEMASLPRGFAEVIFGKSLVFYKAHDFGGHFAALQSPGPFLEDIEAFLAIVKTKVLG